ncbi:MAG: tetratricopeptide repeat protein [Deltaproteobacteria bacterium]|nr:tetratricopeptide repeat protein [Deltaproteobacteria bacterium]
MGDSAPVLIQQAYAFLQRGARDDALKALNRALKAEPNNVDALTLRAGIFVVEEKPKKALADLDRALELAPYSAVAHLTRGDVHEKLGDRPRAQKDFTRAVELDPSSPVARHRRALLIWERDPRTALADLNRVFELLDSYPPAHLDRARVLMKLGRLDDALADLEQARQFGVEPTEVEKRLHELLRPKLKDIGDRLRRDPSDVAAYLERANLLLKKGDVSGAAEDLGHVIDLAPTRVDAWKLRAELRARRGDDEGAVADLTVALGIDPLDTSALRARATSLERLGRLHEALGDLDEMVRLKAKDSDLQLVRAVMLRRLGQPEQAIEWLRAHVDANPNDAVGFEELGLAYSESDQSLLALDQFQAALAIEQTPNRFVLCGAELGRQGRYDEALHFLGAALERDPMSANAFTERGVVLSEMERYDLAMRDYEAALRIDSRSFVAWTNRAGVFLHVARFQDAVREATHAIQLAPHYAVAYKVRAMAFEGLGMAAEFRSDVRDYMRLTTSPSERSWAQSKLRGGV